MSFFDWVKAPFGQEWMISQRERDVLFMYWPICPETLRPFVPALLELDLYEGEAWIGQIPLRIDNVSFRGVPQIPFLNHYLEVDFFALVKIGNRSALYFFSLDANLMLGLGVMRNLYSMPYHPAEMSLSQMGSWFVMDSQRLARQGGDVATFSARYRPFGLLDSAIEGSLAHFLVERYIFFNVALDGTIYEGRVEHEPWLLCSAELEIEINTIPNAIGLDLSLPHVCYFSPGVDVLVRPIRPYPPVSIK